MIRRQFLLYVTVGLLSAAIDIGLMQLLLGAGTGPGLAVSAGFAAGLVFNYLTHLRLTFRATHSLRVLLRFGVLLALNYGLTLACVELSLRSLGSVLPGKLLSLPVVAVNGFVLGRLWVFRQSRPAAP